MKTTILKISILFLFLLSIGAACEKDEESSNNSNGIVGNWQLLQYPETCIGYGDAMIEITPDSVYKLYNDGNLVLISPFSIKSGTMDYDTIFFHSEESDFDYELISLIGDDTLHLVSPILTLTATCDYFKRIK